MCVIIDVPADVQVPWHVLQDCYDSNPDGWGIMFHFNGELFSFKNTTGFDDFLKYWDAAPQDVQRFVHFRIRTHGALNPEMCHPFPLKINDTSGVPHEFLMMHNGMIDIPELDGSKSDTWHFARTLEGVFDGHHDFLEDLTNNVMIADASIGSKLVFLTDTGRVFKFGTWESKHGCSFSNLYFEFQRYYHGKPSKTTYTGQDAWGWPDAGEYPQESMHAYGTPGDSKYLSYNEVIQELDMLIEESDYIGAVKLMQEHSVSVDELARLHSPETIRDTLECLINSYTFTGGA